MGNREQFSCRLDERTVKSLKYLHDTTDWGYGQLIDFAVKLLSRIDLHYKDEKEMISAIKYIMEDFYES